MDLFVQLKKSSPPTKCSSNFIFSIDEMLFKLHHQKKFQ
uniref:Uncharacterized protein n=1 Tax=Arundo donax TaxID=35708 RepID=A0A0A9GPN6_ARUDO